MFVVLEGRLEVVAEIDGSVVSAASLWPGDCFGEMPPFTGALPCRSVLRVIALANRQMILSHALIALCTYRRIRGEIWLRWLRFCEAIQATFFSRLSSIASLLPLV